MEPDKLFYICLYHWFRKLAKLSGIDLFLDDFKPSSRTYVLVVALYILVLCCIWTIHLYPKDEKIICSAFLAFTCQVPPNITFLHSIGRQKIDKNSFKFQGIVKFHSFLSKTKEMKDIIDFSLKIYQVNTNTSANKMRLQKSVNLTVFIFKAGMALLIMTAVLTCIRPCISYILTGKIENIIPAHFPGIDEENIKGYAFVSLFHVYLMFVFVIGTGASDLGLMTIVIHTYTMSHIFQNAVNEFNALADINKRHTDYKAIRASLNNLISMHNDFLKLL